MIYLELIFDELQLQHRRDNEHVVDAVISEPPPEVQQQLSRMAAAAAAQQQQLQAVHQQPVQQVSTAVELE